MLHVANAITITNRVLFAFVKWGIFAIACLMFFEVVSRYSFTSPTSWTPELATLIFGPYFLLGGPYLLHLGGHVAVDIVSSSAKGFLSKALQIMSIVLAILFGAILFRFSFPLALNSFVYAETSYSGWNPVIWPAKAILPAASFLLIIQAIAELIFIVKDKKDKKVK